MNDYMDLMAEFSDRFARGGLQAYKMYEKVLGTEVTVTRVKSTGTSAPESDTQRYNKLLKSAMNISESNAKDHTDTFKTRILLHRSQMTPMYQKMYDEVQVIVTSDIFQPGDLVTFDYMRIHYRMKVAPNIETFGLQDEICWRITLQPYREIKK